MLVYAASSHIAQVTRVNGEASQHANVQDRRGGIVAFILIPVQRTDHELATRNHGLAEPEMGLECLKYERCSPAESCRLQNGECFLRLQPCCQLGCLVHTEP